MKIFTIFLAISLSVLFSSTFLNAQTYFSDDFETGLSKWIRGGNNWDTTSSTYNSSNRCITDSRAGNYTYNSDPIITLSQSLNLTGSTFPVLTFFHKWNLAVGSCCCNTDYDYIYLEISTNGGFNWSQVKQWNGVTNKFYREQINLSNYKFNLVKLRFRLSSHNHCSYVEDGWYIDDVKVQEFISTNPTFVFPFCDDFENGMSKWSTGSFQWDTSLTNPNAGMYCVADSKTGNYTHNSSPVLMMAGVLDLSKTISPKLELFNRYSLAVGNCCCNTDYDYLYLQISTDGGFNWTTLEFWQNTNLAWTQRQYDLTNYRTNKVKIRYYISSYNHCGYTADGAYLDDVCFTDLNPAYINLNLTALIEGFYDTGNNEMARQDTLTVYLRNASSPYAYRDTAKCAISPFTFNGQFYFKRPPTGNYYIVVKHRNSIETWSKSGGEHLIKGDGSVYNYDFTTAACQAYGCNQTLKGTKYCIYSGDVNQDCLVDVADMSLTDNDAWNSAGGYIQTDVNGDYFVDLSDLAIVDNNAYNFVSCVKP